MSIEVEDKNDMAHWWPALRDCGVPTPKTALYDLGVEWAVLADFWGDNGHERHRQACRMMGGLVAFLAYSAPDLVGRPYFLRTGHGSGKHSWSDCCVVSTNDDVTARVAALVEWSSCADFFGLPWRTWAARELLPVDPVATLPRYGGMPLVPELRAFVHGGVVRCVHPYWPAGSIQDGMAYELPPLTPGVLALDAAPMPRPISAEAQALADAADARRKPGWQGVLDGVAAAFAGRGHWSIDLLWTRRGFYAIDMALAENSYHDPSCPSR